MVKTTFSLSLFPSKRKQVGIFVVISENILIETENKTPKISIYRGHHRTYMTNNGKDHIFK